MSRYKAYPAYRDSGVEWLGNIPCDWDCVRLKFASELSGEKVAPSNEERYVGLENVQSNSGKFITTDEVTPEGISNAFSSGDVLFGKLRPYLAKSWLADFSGICSSEFLVLTSRKVNSKFLHYFTLTEEFIKQVDSSTYGSKMPRASWDFIGLLNIPVPRHESEKIADFLDHETAKIDALIEKQQRLIELLKEKRQAVISHAVTKGLNPNAPMKDSGVEWLGEVPAHWEISMVSSVSKKITNGYVGPTKDIFQEEGVRYLQSLHIKNNEIDFHTPYFVSETWSNEKSKSILQFGDVLVVQTGDIGQVAAVNDEFVGCNCHALIVISPTERVCGFYLSWLFNSVYGFNSLKSIQTGALHPHLNCGLVKTIKVVLPPRGEQTEIVSFVKEIQKRFDTLLTKAASQIGLLQERRTALISAAVTGKIDVRDWQPAAA